MNVLTVKGLHKYYNELHAVKGIDFTIKKGEFVALLGPNGAGKSTTINILCTLLSQSEGEVQYGDYSIGADDEKIRSKIGIVFQNNVLDDKLTVRENLETRGVLYLKNRTATKKKVESIIETLQIHDFQDQLYGTLSGGQRRRVDIARALLHSPEILFLDEPTTGLDPGTRKLVWEALEQLRQEGLTIILTTHYMEETQDCDKVIIMNKGKIVCVDTPEQLRVKYTHDVLKVLGNLERITMKLNGYDYQLQQDFLTVKLTDSVESIELLQTIKSDVSAFEVLRGNMDDVFLNLTGSELN